MELIEVGHLIAFPDALNSVAAMGVCLNWNAAAEQWPELRDLTLLRGVFV